MFKLIFEKSQSIKNDVLSGLTVALALIPEAIAFSFVAHVDPSVGLYAAFIMGFVTALIGGRPGMISGATGAVAVIFAPLVLMQTERFGMEVALQYLFLAVLLMGFFQLLFGLFKLGKFIRLIPHPVMLGFVNGLAIVIFKSQLSQFYIGHGENARLLSFYPLMIMVSLIILTMFISYVLPRLTSAVPGSLVAILSVTVLSIGLRNNGVEIHTVLDFVQGMDSTKSTIAVGLPVFSFPSVALNWTTFMTILPYSVLAASVGLIESLMTLTLVDELTETRGRSNKESIAQGLANMLNGVFGGMGGCAMIGQSMINIRAGGRMRISGITAALALLVFILFAAPVIEQIPLAALVGIMFMVVIATFEWSSIRILNKIPRSDAFVLIFVSLVTVIFDLAIAVITGLIVSALVFAWTQGKVIHASVTNVKNNGKLYHLKGNLFFASVSSFKELFNFEGDPENIGLDFSQARISDHSALEAIQNIANRYAKYGKKVRLLNLSAECAGLINKADNIVEVSIADKKTDEIWKQYIAHDRLA